MSAPSGGQNPYADTALDYHKAGWLGPIALPYEKKNPPPEGYTGYGSPYPTIEKIHEWSGEPHNIGVRLADIEIDGTTYEVVGIDVDHYLKGEKLKTGFYQLEKLIQRIGPLPDTWIATSRTDGKSGIRFFLVPTGLKFIGKADKDIDVISKNYRFAAVWPSIHPNGETYWWYPPGVEPTEENKREWDGEIPDPRELSGLPDPWIDYLTTGRKLVCDDDFLIDRNSSVNEIYDWATEIFHGGDDTEPCPKMREKLDKHLKKLVHTSTFHNLLINAQMNLLYCAQEGHHGWYKALTEYEEKYFNAILSNGGGTTERTPESLLGEIFRSRVGAMRKVKAKRCDKNIAKGAKPVLGSCYVTRECKMGDVLRMPNLNNSQPIVTSLADIEPKRVDWLWKGFLPVGKIVILEGEPEVGKSTLTTNWAAIVSTGGQWPDTIGNDGTTYESKKREPAGVLLIGSEDGNEDTVVPRLIVAGADRTRVWNMKLNYDENGNVIPLTIPDDIDMLRRAIVENNIRLVVIDPISAYLPEKANTDKDASVRKNLDPLARLADETGATIVLIRHFTKATGASAKNRGGGSVAYTALARSVISVSVLPESEGDATHGIAQTKGNLFKKVKTITYSLVEAPDSDALPPPGDDDDTGWAVVRYCGTSDLTADQLVGFDDGSTDARKSAPVREAAKEAICDILKDGSAVEANPVMAMAQSLANASKGTVIDAAKELTKEGKLLKAKHYENGKIKYWTWQLSPLVLKLRATDVSVSKTSSS